MTEGVATTAKKALQNIDIKRGLEWVQGGEERDLDITIGCRSPRTWMNEDKPYYIVKVAVWNTGLMVNVRLTEDNRDKSIDELMEARVKETIKSRFAAVREDAKKCGVSLEDHGDV